MNVVEAIGSWDTTKKCPSAGSKESLLQRDDKIIKD